MSPFANPQEATEFLSDSAEAFAGTRRQKERSDSIAMCMVEGVHWLKELAGTSRVERLRAELNPDVPRMRVTLNRVARHTQKEQAATFTERVNFECEPPAADVGPLSSVRAQTCEDALAAMVDSSGLWSSRVAVNNLRCVTGTALLGLDQRRTVRPGEGGPVPDSELTTFCDVASRLTLDPYVTDRDLHRHPFVTYSCAWTYRKLMAQYGEMLKRVGITPDPKTMRPIGELTPFEQGTNRLSDGRLFAPYKTHSTTPGAIVHQVFVRDDTLGRFPTMLIFVEIGNNPPVCINWDSQASPFGGDGLPYAVYHGHQRPDSFWSIGSAAMLKDYQDLLNSFLSVMGRQAVKSAGYQWVVDMSAMGPDKTLEGISGYFTNAVAGIIPWYSGSTEQQRHPPQLVQQPQPQAFFPEMARDLDAWMESQTHRAPINQGIGKSHTTDGTNQSLLAESDQVLGQRAREDVVRDERVLTNMLGTTIALARQRSPGALATLVTGGLSEEQLGELDAMDPVRPPCSVKVPESAVRFVSYSMKRQNLDNALVNKAITNREYRDAMVEFDTPLFRQDKVYATAANRFAMRVLMGQEWVPLPLGTRGLDVITGFQNAMVDKRCDLIPGARERLARAVQSQQAQTNAELASAAAISNTDAPAPTDQPDGLDGQGSLESIVSQMMGSQEVA